MLLEHTIENLFQVESFWEYHSWAEALWTVKAIECERSWNEAKPNLQQFWLQQIGFKLGFGFREIEIKDF